MHTGFCWPGTRVESGREVSDSLVLGNSCVLILEAHFNISLRESKMVSSFSLLRLGLALGVLAPGGIQKGNVGEDRGKLVHWELLLVK